jgi:hypothetical protein
MEQVQEQGLGVLPELIWIVINAAIQTELSEHLQAGAYQHIEKRRNYAKAFKSETMRTRVDDPRVQCHRSENPGSTRGRSKNACGANERYYWLWHRCKFKACPLAK